MPYTLYGLPLTALKYFNLYLHHLYGWNIVGPFLLQLIPRLVMLALSLTVDFTVYQVGVRLFKIKIEEVMWNVGLC